MVIAFVLLFGVVILFGLKITKNPFSVPCAFAIFWFSYFMATYIFTYGEYSWNYSSVFFLLGLSLMLLIGYAIAYKIKPPIPARKSINLARFEEWFFVLIFLGVLAVAFLYVLLLVRSYGFSPLDLLSIQNILKINDIAANMRYTGGAPQSGMFMTLALVFVYASPLIGGFGFNFFQKKRYKLLSCVGIIPPGMVMLFTNEKAVLIGAVFLFICGFISYFFFFNRRPNITKKRIFIVGSLLGIFLFVLLFSMLLRVGSFSMESINYVRFRFMSYAFGSLPAFDNWLATAPLGTYAWGTNTFSGIFDLLGIVERTQGLFEDYFYSGILATNVYTGFRGVVLDTGIIGTLIIFYIIGFISGRVQLRLKQCPQIIGTVFISMFLFFTFFSLFASPYSYNSFFFAFVIYCFFIYFASFDTNIIEVKEGDYYAQENICE